MPPVPSRSGKTAVAIIASVVLIAALIAIGYQWFGKSSAPSPTNAVSIAEPFLSGIREGQVDSAWESTGSEFKSLMGKEEFKKYIKEQPVLKEPLELEHVQEVTINKVKCLQCNFHKKSAPGAKPKVHVLIANSGDAWKVERLLIE